MNLFAIMAKVNEIQNANPVVKELVDGLMTTLNQDPRIMQDLGSTVAKVAELKEMSVQELISSGALMRAIAERQSGGDVIPEKKVAELQAMECKHCGKLNYHLEQQYVRK